MNNNDNTQPQTTKEMGSIRDGFGRGLVEIAEKDDSVVGLCADLTGSVRMDDFEKKFPDRFIQVGIAEQNLAGLAAGLAIAGKKPVAGSYAAFQPGRNFDQIRTSIAYSNLDVTLIGGHAGLSTGPDGATHQMMEDIAMLRALPNMTVVVPCDEEQARLAMHALHEHEGPSYLRLTREKSSMITPELTDTFALGKAQLIRPGKDITIIATGLMVEIAVRAATHLANANIDARVLNIHTISPIDEEAIIKAAYETGAIVTAEEHQINGGLGGAVAEICAENCPVPVKRVGMNQTFGESGDKEALFEKYGLSVSNIVEKAKSAIRTVQT